MKEIWVDIEGYEGLYKISNLGNVYSYHIKRNKKIQTNNKGYKCIHLNKQGKRKSKLIHQLLAKIFIPNPNNKLYINHINGIKTDNRIKNLEWCTQKENIVHSFNIGLSKHGQEHHSSLITEEEAIDIIERLNIGQKNCNIHKETGISLSIITDIKHNNTWKHLESFRKYKTNKRKIISEEVAKNIINRLNKHEKICNISKELQVSSYIIVDIKRKKTWKHLSHLLTI